MTQPWPPEGLADPRYDVVDALLAGGNLDPMVVMAVDAYLALLRARQERLSG